MSQDKKQGLRVEVFRLKAVPVWVRFIYNPPEGIIYASGDCMQLLGISAEDLLGLENPVLKLPDFLSEVLSGTIKDEPVIIQSSGIAGTILSSEQGVEVFLYRTEIFSSSDEKLLNEISAGIVGVDENGICRIWNRAMTRIFKIKQNQTIGKKLEDILPQPILYSWDSVVESVFRGRLLKVECRLKKDSRIEATFSPGGPGVVGTFFDTTESYRTERRLRTNRRMNQTYFQTINTGLVLFGKDYRILVSNPYFGKLFGLSENLMGMPIYEILPRESFLELEKASSSIFEDQAEPLPVTVSYTHPDGDRRSMSQIFRPLKGEDGKTSYAVGIFENITDITSSRNRMELEKKRTGLVSILLDSCFSENLHYSYREIVEAARKGLDAESAALYLVSPYESTRLVSSTENWPDALYGNLSELNLPDSVWNERPGIRLSDQELGALSSCCNECLVFPVDCRGETTGFLVICDPGTQDDGVEQFCSLLVQITMIFTLLKDEKSGREHAGYLLEKERGSTFDFLSELQIPVAGFTEGWRPILWNKAMQKLTGCSFERALKRFEVARDILFSDAGGISAAKEAVSEGRKSGTPAIWSITGSDKIRKSVSWQMFDFGIGRFAGENLVTILAGLPIEQSDIIEESAEGLRKLGLALRWMRRIHGATKLQEITDMGANALLEICDAREINVELSAGLHAMAKRAGTQNGIGISENWENSFPSDGHTSIKYSVSSGIRSPLADEICKAIQEASLRFKRNDLARKLKDIVDIRSSRIFITDSKGNFLLSSYETISESCETANIADIFTNKHIISETLSGISKTGKFVVSAIRESDRSKDNFLAVRLGTMEESPVLWIPINQPAPGLSETFEPESPVLELQAYLVDVIQKAISVNQSRIQEVRKLISQDDPLSPILSTSLSEYVSLIRLAEYLRLLTRAGAGNIKKLNPEGILKGVVEAISSEFRDPPSLVIDGFLPDVEFDEELMKFVLKRLSELISPAGSGEIAVRSVRLPGDPSRIILETKISGSVSIREYSEEQSIISDLEEGIFSTTTELSLIQMLLVFSGGDCTVSSGGDEFSVQFPSVKQKEQLARISNQDV